MNHIETFQIKIDSSYFAIYHNKGLAIHMAWSHAKYYTREP